MKKIFIIALVFCSLSFFCTIKDTHALSDVRLVNDFADILSEEELNKLEDKAEQISNKYKIAVYITTFEDYRKIFEDSGNTYSLKEVAEEFFTYNDLGYGKDKDAIMLTLSMKDRKYWMLGHGYRGNEFLSDYAREEVLIPSFLDDFKDDDWYGGFSDYLETADEIFEYEVNHGSMTEENNPKRDRMRQTLPIVAPIGGGLIIGLITTLIITLGYRRAMNTALLSVEASQYVSEGGFNLTESRDAFNHQEVTRVLIRKDDDDDSSSGGGSDGGFSGSGGDF